MDFKSIIAPIRFGPKPADQNEEPGRDVPKPILARELSRRKAALREAADVLAVLPEEEGQALHFLQTGRYDLADILALLLDKYGVCEKMTVATLAFSARNARQILGWIDNGLVKEFTLLVSEFFKGNSTGVYDELLTGLAERGDIHKLAADRNHAKIVCFEFTSGVKLVISSSSNLRSNGNREAGALFRDKDLHDYHAAWIRSECGK
jgi:hypothetical protein